MSRFRTLAVLGKIPAKVILDDGSRVTWIWARFPAAVPSAEALQIDEEDLPEALRERLDVAARRGEVYHTHCIVNLGAEVPDDLKPSDWELS